MLLVRQFPIQPADPRELAQHEASEPLPKRSPSPLAKGFDRQLAQFLLREEGHEFEPFPKIQIVACSGEIGQDGGEQSDHVALPIATFSALSVGSGFGRPSKPASQAPPHVGCRSLTRHGPSGG